MSNTGERIMYSLYNESRKPLQIGISPNQMASQEKKYKAAKMKEILSAVCALLNSGGGKLELFLDSNPNKRLVDTCIRMIEQRIREIIGVTVMAMQVKFQVNAREIILTIPAASEFISVNYNLYLPSERQVISVPATEPTQKIKKIIRRRTVCYTLADYQTKLDTIKFVKDRHSGITESSKDQLKNLEPRPSKCVTLADRMVGKSNKLPCYVSAFANHEGGTIYYGVNDEGIVEGEVIGKKDKEEITKKVSKAINNMVWPSNCGKPRRGRQWQIWFKPVEDTNGDHISSTFVVVIHIVPCPGGVFVEEPESYQVVEGVATKISFDAWLPKLTESSTPTRERSIPQPMRRVASYSNRTRKIFCEITTRLIHFRNNDKIKSFQELTKLTKENLSESESCLLVTPEEVMVALKKHYFLKAESLLRTFAQSSRLAENSLIFNVRMLQLKSRIERSKGNFEESYEIAQEGLQNMKLIDPEYINVWFYLDAAMVATILSKNVEDSQRSAQLRNEARHYLDLAARNLSSLTDLPEEASDIQHKLHIYEAFVLLESSITGEVAPQEYVTREAIAAAAKVLASVHEAVLMGNPLTHCRKVQYYFAQSDLFRRRLEKSQQNYLQNATQAFELATQALNLAKKNNFQDMVEHAHKRRSDLTELLVRNFFTSQRKHVPLTRSFDFLSSV